MPKREYSDEERERRRLAYNARKRAWRAANLEKAKEIDKRYYDSRKDDPKFQQRNRTRVAAWQRANRDRVNATSRRNAARPEQRARKRAQVLAWNARNPARLAALTFKNHALRRGPNAPDDEALDFAAILRHDPCAYCGEPTEEIDHIVPIASGGENAWGNLTGACRGCNRLKSTKSLLTHLRTRG